MLSYTQGVTYSMPKSRLFKHSYQEYKAEIAPGEVTTVTLSPEEGAALLANLKAKVRAKGPAEASRWPRHGQEHSMERASQDEDEGQ
jgi:hypothetical protein